MWQWREIENAIGNVACKLTDGKCSGDVAELLTRQLLDTLAWLLMLQMQWR